MVTMRRPKFIVNYITYQMKRNLSNLIVYKKQRPTILLTAMIKSKIIPFTTQYKLNLIILLINPHQRCLKPSRLKVNPKTNRFRTCRNKIPYKNRFQ